MHSETTLNNLARINAVIAALAEFIDIPDGKIEDGYFDTKFRDTPSPVNIYRTHTTLILNLPIPGSNENVEVRISSDMRFGNPQYTEATIRLPGGRFTEESVMSCLLTATLAKQLLTVANMVLRK